jgi:hypothetical protein
MNAIPALPGWRFVFGLAVLAWPRHCLRELLPVSRQHAHSLRPYPLCERLARLVLY